MAEIAEFAGTHDMQLLALEGISTQYMWTTMRKKPPGWFTALAEVAPTAKEMLAEARIRNACSAHSGEPAVPARGRYANVALWVERLPADCDLNQINITVDGQDAAPLYLGEPLADGLCQVNAWMPRSVRTGLVEVELRWFGEPLGEPVWLRVVPPGPAVTQITAVTDGVNFLNGAKITSRMVKLSMEELTHPDKLEVSVNGTPVHELDKFCTDPNNERYEINFPLPDTVGRGPSQVEVTLGSRHFAPAPIEVV
ncbi:MAG: hypothetical protein L0271_26905 [Gemmatimonadetes bacterium]|nr:hypothetical protein [Gemmatimonadota bacterium]